MFKPLITGAAIAGLLLAPLSGFAADQSPATIAEQATVYGLPMVDLYKLMYDQAIDKDNPQFKAPFNTLHNESNVFTPADTTIVTPNSDTPYSELWMDLRAEPMVLCVPAVDKDRYYSVMLTSLYTFNFGYIGSRTTGNDAACYAVAGPEWQGDTPKGIAKVFQSETEFATALYRTQLFDPADIDNVRKIQAGYTVEPLSAFLGEPAPAAPPAVDWPKIDNQSAKDDLLNYLAFLLQFAPATGPAAVEQPMRAAFESIGLEAGKPFPPAGASADELAAIKKGSEAGFADVIAKLKHMGENENGWSVTTGITGDRAGYNGDWALRAAVAVAGLLANDTDEAVYPITNADVDGQKLDGSKSAYTITFKKGELPPANAFWSVTMYDGKTQHLVANPIDRYLINTPMLPDLTTNADGSLTLYVQKDEPSDPAKKANWLPAPDGPFYLAMRIYWPKQAVLDGDWQPPGIIPHALTKKG
ncbi:DUF1254 domain-containing protein [Martelella endophytica]|uniref:Cell envelope protein n=1 Tax=Martelella endophytica TaxID=1486262 RepID=A0A0D5LUD2_MAREN|nr:DUF1254 domain-containing protein [Martelella endophytica]AJY47585.1 cell envelope protein [Martelella endophytica]